MAGRLKQIVDQVKAKVILKNLATSTLSMKLGTNVDNFTETTPDDPQIEQKLLAIAKELLGDKYSEIRII
ncbi:MAG: hypothetical protein ABH882_02510 [Candidatus Omnitrophota bacterium]|nr:hypothetical protein [Candidatus Omnitrophota bacterium]MBU1928925.1 hypothetical protein [Candidatus Omnitrophota bacterium]MBU2035350.1 hypothetical protein [Candidatus Omnitrophota bacterium]MBU2221348.1 hypothetical protein [Candidatus Omnitrophota bacterium]MBU2258748.1 hypothetical protein [Candidatus Omnitrophota bacterium]